MPAAFGTSGDGRGQAIEDPGVDRVKGVPIDKAGQSLRTKRRRLFHVGRPVGCRGKSELKPGPTGKLHLSAQSQEAVDFEILDSPEVDSIANAQVVGMASSPAQSGAAQEPVQHSANPPGPVGEIPSPRRTNTSDHPVDVLSRGRDSTAAALDDQSLTCFEHDLLPTLRRRAGRVAPRRICQPNVEVLHPPV